MGSIASMNNYVLVRLDGPEEKAIGPHGIIIPAMKMDRVATGTVVSVGPTVRVKELQPGVRVLFPPSGAGKPATVDGLPHLSLLDWEILGYFEAR